MDAVASSISPHHSFVSFLFFCFSSSPWCRERADGLPTTATPLFAVPCTIGEEGWRRGTVVVARVGHDDGERRGGGGEETEEDEEGCAEDVGPPPSPAV